MKKRENDSFLLNKNDCESLTQRAATYNSCAGKRQFLIERLANAGPPFRTAPTGSSFRHRMKPAA